MKPANVMLTASGAVLTDFGLAVVSGVSRLTRTGSTVGTAAYLSPEQVQGGDADERADVWALGVLLYEMVSGRLPFGGEQEQALFYAILSAEPVPLATKASGLPAGLDGILGKALAKDRTQRYQRVNDLVADLAALTRDREALPAGRARRQRPRGLLAAAAAGVVAVTLAAAVALNVAGLRDRFLAGGPPIRSIAVLPLANLSGDPEQEYFADGMTEALINDLCKVAALRVTSRTSVMQYKDGKKPLKEIARELHVDAIVEGSVTRAGERVKVSAQLIRAGEERQLWADSFERDMRDILALQGELAGTIAGAVRVRLTPQDHVRLASSRAVAPGAYEAYLQGQASLTGEFGGAGRRLEEAREAFERAIEIDPGFAPAHAGLSGAYTLMAMFGQAPGEVAAKAMAAATRAVQLDGTCAEAQAALGDAKLSFAWDWAGADAALTRALELNPHSFYVRDRRLYFCVNAGRFAEAIRLAGSLVEDQPHSRPAIGDLGWVLFYARRYDEAISAWRQAVAVNPQWLDSGGGLPGIFLAACYACKGMNRDALAICDSLDARGRLPAAFGGWIYARAGRRDKALAQLERLREGERQGYQDPYYFACIYAGLGDKENAFAYLRKGVATRSVSMVCLKTEVLLDPLRSDPRYAELLGIVGPPEGGS